MCGSDSGRGKRPPRRLHREWPPLEMPMNESPHSAPASDLLAAFLGMLSFSVANAIWFHWGFEQKSNLYALAVQLVAASGVGLALLAWKLRQGRLTPEALGFGLWGWTAGKRLFALF